MEHSSISEILSKHHKKKKKISNTHKGQRTNSWRGCWYNRTLLWANGNKWLTGQYCQRSHCMHPLETFLMESQWLMSKCIKLYYRRNLFWLLRNEKLFHVYEKMAYLIFIWLFWYIIKKKQPIVNQNPSRLWGNPTLTPFFRATLNILW